MAWTAQRRLQVLAGTTLGGLTATKPFSVGAASNESTSWRSSYISLGMTDPSVIADRSIMNKLYVDDIKKLQKSVPQCPEHLSLLRQPSYTQGGQARLRILTWNINMLCGPDGSASVGSQKRIDPDLVADLIKKINPDIVCLQETIDWMPLKYKEYLDKHGVGELDVRMRRLNDRLREQGFGKLLRSCAPPSNGSPNLLASRVPVLHEETFTLAPERAETFGTTPRSAAYVEIKVSQPGNTSLGIYVTHLHHMNHVPKEGQRAAEIESLLGHVSARKKFIDRTATVLTGDFNQARRQDLTPAEWNVVSAALAKIKQPENDGVSEALQRAGFGCTYDASLQETNFGGRNAPAFTHWTGTTVDYLYFLDESACSSSERHREAGSAAVQGSFVVFSDLSDHLPIVTDLSIELPSRHSST